MLELKDRGKEMETGSRPTREILIECVLIALFKDLLKVVMLHLNPLESISEQS